VIVAAAIPAVLYYVALYCMTDLEAVKQGLRGLSRAQLPQFWAVLKEGFHLLIPIIILLYQLVIIHSSVARAGFLSIASIIVFSWFRKKSRLGFKGVIEAIREGALSAVSIAALCACAGIIVGVISMTGLGVRFGSTIIPLSGGYLFITLFFSAILCLLLGMGLPTTASYIIAAAIGGPALVKLGVTPLAAHLFVFYFACLSAITPPECGAIFTACGFSKTPPMETGWIAMRLAFPAYIIPFIFIYHPVLLMKGSLFDVSYQFVMSCIGVGAMSMALVGTSYFGNVKWSILTRLFFAASFFGFIIPGWELDFWAVVAILLGFLGTSQTRRLIIKVIPSFSSPHRTTSKVVDSDIGKD
jgi:TRAP transporter 4TM/12TM fusion protein